MEVNRGRVGVQISNVESVLSVAQWVCMAPLSWEPYFQFSETTPHFIQNLKKSLMNSWNIKMNLYSGGLEPSFGLTGPKKFKNL